MTEAVRSSRETSSRRSSPRFIAVAFANQHAVLVEFGQYAASEPQPKFICRFRIFEFRNALVGVLEVLDPMFHDTSIAGWQQKRKQKGGQFETGDRPRPAG